MAVVRTQSGKVVATSGGKVSAGNCGTGAGGFKHSNTCAKGGGKVSADVDPAEAKQRIKAATEGLPFSVETEEDAVGPGRMAKRVELFRESYNDLTSRFPKVAEALEESPLKAVRFVSKVKESPGNAAGFYRSGSSIIDLAPNVTNDKFAGLLWTADHGHAFRHELGHHFDIAGGLDFKPLRELYQSKDGAHWQKTMGANAASHGREFVAEAFEIYTSPLYGTKHKSAPKPLPPEVAKAMADVLGK